MMKRRAMWLLALPLISLACGNVHARADHNGFIAGACVIGAAFLGAAGIAAVVDYCCSETDDQVISRVSNDYRTIIGQYQQTMDYFGSRAGVGIHAPHRPIQYIPETVLYEFATYVWNSGVSQVDYRSEVWSTKRRLQSGMNDIRKRVRSLEGKSLSYEKTKQLAVMRNLLNDVDQLLTNITLFADCLECHKTYFNLYDSVGNIRNRYLSYITILESERYSIFAEIKHCVISYDSGQYAFKNFVKHIESDIAILQSTVDALAHNYDAGRRYAQLLINQLINIKNIVVSDPRYQQELYAWEQACLERKRIEAIEAQARLERDRINIERERNRLLDQQLQLFGVPKNVYICF